MRRDEVVSLLRKLPQMRMQVDLLEQALGSLSECEGAIIDKMIIRPVPRASDQICEMFDIEVAAVYRRRNKALKKLADCLSVLG